MMQREFPEDLFALRRECKQNLATVLVATLSIDITSCRQPVHQFDCAVMLNLEPFGQFADPWADPLWQTLSGPASADAGEVPSQHRGRACSLKCRKRRI